MVELILLLLGFIMMFSPLIVMVLNIVGQWCVFKKAGEKGWKVLIPFYNKYTMLKIGGKKDFIPLYWIATAISILSFAAVCYAAYGMIDNTMGALNNLDDIGNLEYITSTVGASAAMIFAAIAFWISGILSFIVHVHALAGICTKMEQDGAMTVGLLVLPPVFWMVLGFSERIQWQYEISLNALYSNNANNEEETL